MPEICAFEVSVVRKPEWAQTINATTAGRAKSVYLRELNDPWPDIPYTALRCRKLGGPRTSEKFQSTARNRGVPNLRCGQAVTVNGKRGVVVDSDYSANFVIEFDAGYRGSAHIGEITLVSPTPTT